MEQNARTMFNQGYCFYTGSHDYPLNHSKALACFQEGARLGNSDAMNYLGIMYENGQAVPKNVTAAAEWYERAHQADPNNRAPAYNLGRFFYLGIAKTKNIEQAHKYLSLAVQLSENSKDAIYGKISYMLGLLYMEAKKDYVSAYQCFLNAARYANIAEAWHNCGFLIQNHVLPSGLKNGYYTKDQVTVERNKMARDYYEKAAQLGFALSMTALGALYLKYQQNSQAREWFRRAAQLGEESAKKRLKMLNVTDRLERWS